MAFTWTWDAPTGVFKNHAMSSKIRFAAQAQSKFNQFANPEPGYGKKKGESVTIKRVSNLDTPTNARLTESAKIPEDEISLSTIAITVSEWGRSVPYSSLVEDLSDLDFKNLVQRKLRDQMSLVMDGAAAAAFKTADVKAIATGVSAITFDTDGTASSPAVANLNFYHLEQIRDYMFSTLLVPPYAGDDYVCCVSTKAARGIKNDPRWEEWHKYTTPELKFKSELGKLENFRFVEINNTSALSGSIGTGSVAGEAVMFGEDAVAMAVVTDPELRAKIPGDYGREQGVAWYGIMEWGIIWDTANAGEARVVHFASS